MNVMGAALQRKFEPPPRSTRTSIAISMIEKIANIPIVFRRDDMVRFSCALEDKSGLIAVPNQCGPLLLCGGAPFGAASIASGDQRADWSGSAISRARDLT
jgi:hypothetical protein